MCKHDLYMLVGEKDGILCRACGRKFESFKALESDRQQQEAPEETAEEKPKRGRPKKAREE